MAKKFKKNQPIIATLPTGRVVEGYYDEPYGTDGHSFYVDEYCGERGGKPIFKKIMYGVKDEFIDSVNESPAVSDAQYKAWLKRAMILEDRIKEDENSAKELVLGGADENEIEKVKRKIERNKSKLEQINEKIKEFEGE